MPSSHRQYIIYAACQKSLFDKLVDGRASYPQFAMVVLHLRTVPSSAARCFASADFASLCVLEASAASRPPMKAELPCLLGSSYRSALRWPGIPGLRSASRCPRPSTPSGLRRLRPVSATGGGLRAPLPVSAKILRIFGRGNCKEAIFALENGIFRRGVLRAPAPLNSAWSSAALTGSLAALPASLGLLRPVSRTARGLRAPPPYTPPGTIEMQKGFALLRALTKYRKNEAFIRNDGVYVISGIFCRANACEKVKARRAEGARTRPKGVRSAGTPRKRSAGRCET